MKGKEEMGEGPSLAKPAGCETRRTNWLSALSCCSLPLPWQQSCAQQRGELAGERRGCREQQGRQWRCGNRRGAVLLAVSCRYLRVHQWPGTLKPPSELFFASQEFLRGCLVQTKAASLSSLAVREQLNSSACLAS